MPGNVRGRSAWSDRPGGIAGTVSMPFGIITTLP